MYLSPLIITLILELIFTTIIYCAKLIDYSINNLYYTREAKIETIEPRILSFVIIATSLIIT